MKNLHPMVELNLATTSVKDKLHYPGPATWLTNNKPQSHEPAVVECALGVGRYLLF